MAVVATPKTRASMIANPTIVVVVLAIRAVILAVFFNMVVFLLCMAARLCPVCARGRLSTIHTAPT